MTVEPTASGLPAAEPIQRPFRDVAPGGTEAGSLDLRTWIRDVPDFPKPGILFRDFTPMMRDPRGWQQMVRQLSAVCDRLQPEVIVGIESRGFLVGTALATALALPFAPVRKPGKLPGPVHGIDYSLEYGSDRLEIHADGLNGNPTVLVVDDLLATGGTAAATGELVTLAGGRLAGFAFVVELEALQGRKRLPDGVPVEALIRYI
jgi:adenine phosphoribosyltransferase